LKSGREKASARRSRFELRQGVRYFAMNNHVSKSSHAHGSKGIFHLCAHKMALAVGSPWAFVAAALVVAIWALLGPVFHYSDTWQLVINTGTTIVTFLMVFLIENTQNRDTKAMHLKLDELIRGVHGARTRLMNLAELSDEEVDKLQAHFDRLQKAADRRQHKRAN